MLWLVYLVLLFQLLSPPYASSLLSSVVFQYIYTGGVMLLIAENETAIDGA